MRNVTIIVQNFRVVCPVTPTKFVIMYEKTIKNSSVNTTLEIDPKLIEKMIVRVLII